MYRVMTAEEAMGLIRDGDVVALNSFLGIDNPVELHEALYRRYKKTGSQASDHDFQCGLWGMG